MPRTTHLLAEDPAALRARRDGAPGLLSAPESRPPSVAAAHPATAGRKDSTAGLVPSVAGLRDSVAAFVPSAAGLRDSVAGLVPSAAGLSPSRFDWPPFPGPKNHLTCSPERS